jgi:hypothetical protein
MRRVRGALVAAVALGLLSTPGEASAADCVFTGPGNDWHGGTNWTCGHPPTADDNAFIGVGDDVTVAAVAEAGLLRQSGGVITFSGGTNLSADSYTAGDDNNAAFVKGNGVLTVGGSFTKTGSQVLTVMNNGGLGSADLILNGTATFDEGTICVGRDGDADPDQPSLQINNTFTIADGVAATPFPCTSGPRIHVNAPNGHLIKTAAGTASTGTGIDNDGTITVQAGTLNLGGPTVPETSDGDYVANAGATLEFANNIDVGASGRVGGAGAIDVRGLNLTMAAGSTLDPAVLNLEFIGYLDLNGTTPVTLPVLNIDGGGFQATLDSTRPITANSLSVTSGTLRGTATTTVPSGGSFTKTTSGSFFISGDANLVLNEDGTLDGGLIGLDNQGGTDPGLFINETFTIAAGAAANPFPSTSGPRIHVNAPNGHLVKAAPGTMSTGTGIDNDGTLTVQAGTLTLDGPTVPETSDGDYVATAGTTLEFANNISVGATGRVGGAGTIDVRGLNLTVAAGATFDPAVLNLEFIGFLDLNGTTPVTLPVLNIDGGGFLATLDSTRPITTNALSVTSGAIQNDFALTVASGGSFSKTTGGPLYVRNSGTEGSADLVLNVDASLDGGFVCVATNDSSVTDNPNLRINRDFTIGAGADPTVFPCTPVPALDPRIHVNGPNGRLLKAGPGTTTSNQLIHVAGGSATVAAGQTLVLNNGLLVTGGLAEVASGGVLQGSVALVDGTPGPGGEGTLGGGGQVSGHVTNFSGIVRPGTSPGTLTITGDYRQDPAATLRVDVNGTGQGTAYDHLDVGGTASLAGTLAIVQGAGFEPQLSDTFHFLTSGSRTGTFATVTGQDLPTGDSYSVGYPGAPDFGARLQVLDGPPPPPTLTDTDPDSPANDNNPRVKGSAPGAELVRIFKTPDCSDTPVEIPRTEFSSPGAPVSVPDDSTTTFHATAVDASANVSACSSSSITYVEQTPGPNPPTFTDTDPDSPANDNNPRVKGTAPGAVSVRVYKTANCTGPAVEIPASDFASPGAPVNVPDNSTTTFHATAVDASANVSACSSSSITYVEDSAAPAAPTLTDTDPDSPFHEDIPRIKGTAEAGSTVRLYTNPACFGSPAAAGPATQFVSEGIGVTVPRDSTTTFRATARDAAGNTSACSSSSITYVERLVAPTFTDTDPDSPADSDHVFIKGTAPEGNGSLVDVTVTLYTSSNCLGGSAMVAGTGTGAAFESPGILVSVQPNSTTTFHATVTIGNRTSACSTSSITYVNTPVPAAPTFTDTDPDSPAADTHPRIKGTAPMGDGSLPEGSTVTLYTTPNCTGSAEAAGTAAEFASQGIGVSVPRDSTTTFHATATIGNHTSACSTSSITYEETLRSPTFTDTDPDSPANDNAPEIKGSAPEGDATLGGLSTVNLYTSSDCSGQPVASGPRDLFASHGLTVNVADNSTTTFRATTTSGSRVSKCSSSSITYVEATPSNKIDIGKVVTDKGAGTAIIVIKVPGPGTLTLAGAGVKSLGTARAPKVAKVRVDGAGKVRLRFTAKGKAKRLLNRTGRVRLKVKVTYTPAGGDANRDTKTVTLIKD